MTLRQLPLTQYIDHDNSTISYSYRILSAQFGDGYEQVVSDGINTESRTWSINYKNLPKDAFDAVIAFVRSLKGVEPILATAPGESIATQWRIVKDSLSSSVTGISRNDQNIIVRSITFQLRSVHVVN